MKAFEHVQVESDREFVERILKELDELDALRERFAETRPGDSWQGRAWGEFVERYSGVVYDQALRLTWRETHYQHGEKRSVFLFGKRRELSDAAQNAYLWLLEQLQLKLRFYERAHEMPLADFIKMNLHSKYLLIDYLRWRDGYLPKVIAKCSREEKQVFYGLQRNLYVEEIAATIGLKTENEAERTKALETVLKMRENIIAKLKHAGQMHALNRKPHIALDNETEDFIAAPEDWSTDDDISLQDVEKCFASALRKLAPQELSLLQLFYLEKFTTAEILGVYRQAGINLPHVNKAPGSAALADVRKALEKTRAKLLKLLQKECEDLPEASIKSKIVLELLKLLGVILS